MNARHVIRSLCVGLMPPGLHAGNRRRLPGVLLAACAAAVLTGPATSTAISVPVHFFESSAGSRPCTAPGQLCTENPTDRCQSLEFPRVAATSYQSMGIAGGAGGARLNTVADHFRTGASGGTVTSLCWWGTYATACGAEPAAASDHFFVRILPPITSGPDAGAPDAANPIAVFEQGQSMAVALCHICDVNARSTTEYTAVLAGGVTLDPNTCYFLEIRNQVDGAVPGTPASNWFWSHSVLSTDNTCYQSTTGAYTSLHVQPGNRAFCVGITLNVSGTQLCLPPTNPPPANDSCVSAETITGMVTLNFDNSQATTNAGEGQSNAACNYAGATAAITKDVWYDWTAAAPGFSDGQLASVTVTTCGSVALIDSKMAVYNSAGAGNCPTSANLIDCVDDVCSSTPVGVADIAASVTFNAVIGQHYIIQVGGGAPTAAGPQTLFITATAATGSCCLTSGACAQVTSARCTALGGTFGGAGSSCGSSYTMSTGTASLETLTSPTTIAFANGGDDDYTNIPLGMTFSFYGTEYTTANVGVNGQIAFGGPLFPFATTWPIPTHPVEPNNYLAVAADDFIVASGGGAGTVRYQTIGAGADQHVVIQWTGVSHFNFFDSNTFQAILYASGNIEFRYGAMTAPEVTPTGGTGPGYIRGIESESGVGSIALTGPNGGPAPAVGSRVLFTYNSDPGDLCPIAPPCPCDWNHDTFLNSQDFFDFIVSFFKGNADFNGDMLTNSQDFFDFLTCFFTPPMGC